MATLESFEGLLKELVNAKRLSASGMNTLTDKAMALMENDTQLITILYRTHKTLSPSSKIHSLYTFDALARAARSKVNKLGLSGDIYAEKGNCATFLLKMDGILDSLIQDMISLETSEAKEKTKKILDIWTKNNTFSPSVLARLADITKDTHKDANATPSNTPPIDPRAASASGQVIQPMTTTTTTTPTDPTQAQALLQALLTSAVSSAIPATTSVTGSAGNQIGTSAPIDQVALLQQLVEKAKSSNGLTPLPAAAVASSSNNAPIVPPQTRPVQSIPPLSSSYNAVAASQDQSFDIKRGDPYANKPGQRYLNNDNYDQRSPRDRGNHDEARDRERPSHWRGNYRGRGGFGGRGGRGHREYDDRDGFQRRHRSRSKSPSRFSGRGRGRDIRPYSPPHRPSLSSALNEDTRDSQPTVPLEAGKDEFGRDIRPSSEAPEQNPAHASQPENPSTEDRKEPVQDSTSLKPKGRTGPGLDSFDFTVFDFSSPAAWEALGNAWEATHGVLPSQEQLMQFVMEKMSQGNPMMNNHTASENNFGGRWNSQQQQQQQYQQPGKSIPTYESGSNLVTNSWEGQGSSWGKEEAAYDYEHGMFPMNADTDAVVLGGGDQTTAAGLQAENNGSTASGRGGGMKRVGDKWVWQRS